VANLSHRFSCARAESRKPTHIEGTQNPDLSQDSPAFLPACPASHKPAQYRRGLKRRFGRNPIRFSRSCRRDGVTPRRVSYRGRRRWTNRQILARQVRRELRILTIWTVRNGIKQPARRVSEGIADALGYRGRASGSAGRLGYRGRPHSILRRPGTSVRGGPRWSAARAPLPPPGRPIFTTWVM